MKFAIIGCGLIGLKRAEAAVKLGHAITAAADLDLAKASALASRFGGKPSASPADALSSDADVINVAVSHERLAELALAAVKSGKHLLLEKPGARNARELLPAAEEAASRGLKVKVGYNHRFHPSFRKARELYDSGALGPLLYVRGR